MTNEYTFDFDAKSEWRTFLSENGFVVLRNVATKQQVNGAVDAFWTFFEREHDVDRHDVETWKQWHVDSRGIVVDGAAIQCSAAWSIRALPKVKEAFAQIWRTDELLVSMDSPIVWKPWWIDSDWQPRTEGLHVDQNPFRKPDSVCVQGMVPLFDVTTEIGGLQVVPRSHKGEIAANLKKRHERWKSLDDFCMLARHDPLNDETKLLLANAGDLILWDSRTVHGGHVGGGEAKSASLPAARLARLSQTVCMTPRSLASPRVLKERRDGFARGLGFSHWPHEAHVTCGSSSSNYAPIVLTEEQDALL